LNKKGREKWWCAKRGWVGDVSAMDAPSQEGVFSLLNKNGIEKWWCAKRGWVGDGSAMGVPSLKKECFLS